MAIVVPGASVNYKSPLKALASPFGKEPKEGRYQIPVEILWKDYTAPYVLAFNLQNSGDTKAISQFCAMHVDNSACGADIQFIFTDTSETVTIPAYCSYALVPIFSRSLSFYVVAGINSEVVLSSDVTRFQMFNFVPPPVVVSQTEEQSIAAVTGIDLTTTGLKPIIAAGTNGTLEALNLTIGLTGTSLHTGSFQFQDGAATPKVLWTGTFTENTDFNYLLADLTGLHVRFTNGINLNVVATSLTTGCLLNSNLYYRTP